MDTQCSTATNPAYTLNFGALGSGNGDGGMSEEEEQDEEVEDDEEEQAGGNARTPAGSTVGLAKHSPPTVTPQTQSSALTDWTSNTEGEIA